MFPSSVARASDVSYVNCYYPCAVTYGRECFHYSYWVSGGPFSILVADSMNLLVAQVVSWHLHRFVMQPDSLCE
jgi:hypothetical protein